MCLPHLWQCFSFIADLKQSQLVFDQPSDVTELYHQYDTTLATLLDKHASWRQVKYRARRGAPWYDAECRATKSTTRRLEKAYRRQRSSQSEQAWRAQFSHQRALFQQKFVDNWSHTIDACHGDSKTLRSKLRPLLQPQSDNTSCLTADDHAQYFTSKIDRIRASTATSLLPIVYVRHVPELLSAWRPATVEELASILKESAAK